MHKIDEVTWTENRKTWGFYFCQCGGYMSDSFQWDGSNDRHGAKVAMQFRSHLAGKEAS
jgi:hypothetical protein